MPSVRVGDLPDLHPFVNGLHRKFDAAMVGLSLGYNSGSVEGHVNRIK